MCGILCLISSEGDNEFNNLYEKCICNIKRRGPDSFKSIIYNNIKLTACVLWLQGAVLTKQPIESDKSIFAFNGDIFGGSSIINELKNNIGDTNVFLKALDTCINLVDVLSNIEGPYAFIYLNKIESKLYFGRDIYGRRSLLIGKNCDNYIISSVAIKNQFTFIELPAIGTFTYNLNDNGFELYPWKVKNRNFEIKFNEIKKLLGCDIQIIQQFDDVALNQFIAPTIIDLQCFDNIKSLINENRFNQALKELIKNDLWFKRVLKLENKLALAIKKRILKQPNYCRDCIHDLIKCNHCRIGVLFSGGLDCAILALIADKYIDKDCPIDLLNVAFGDKSDAAPDRITGQETFNELCRLRPDRNWRFCELNVTTDELNLERNIHIKNLIYPLNTILDDSLGCALWFASRGKSNDYISTCRVLLAGMGADELFGGYTRHKAALQKRGWSGLFDCLEDDWQNISHRNLARDDRVVSDHGRQLKTPYLDEDVVEYVRNLNVWEKTYPEILPEIGPKILLRTLAIHLGLENAAFLKKKALQFGTKIANKKENAHEISPRLL